MTSGEYVSLIANYNKIDSNEDYNKLKDRGYSKQHIDDVMKDKSFQSTKSLNITFTEPISLYCAEFGYYSSIYGAYLKGHLPYRGSYVDQPAKAIDIIQTLDALYAETSKKEHDKQMKEFKKRGK